MVATPIPSPLSRTLDANAAFLLEPSPAHRRGARDSRLRRGHRRRGAAVEPEGGRDPGHGRQSPHPRLRRPAGPRGRTPRRRRDRPLRPGVRARDQPDRRRSVRALGRHGPRRRPQRRVVRPRTGLLRRELQQLLPPALPDRGRLGHPRHRPVRRRVDRRRRRGGPRPALRRRLQRARRRGRQLVLVGDRLAHGPAQDLRAPLRPHPAPNGWSSTSRPSTAGAPTPTCAWSTPRSTRPARTARTRP